MSHHRSPRELTAVTSILLTLTCFSIPSAFGQCQTASRDTDCATTETLIDQEIKSEGSCSDGWTKLEQYAVNEIDASQPAKLNLSAKELKGLNSTQPVIRGCFIKALLTGGFKVPSAGVDIRDATIQGPVDLRNADVPYNVDFTNCHFLNVVDLKRSHFAKSLSFTNSCFDDRLDAESATIEMDLILQDSALQNCITFLKSLKIGGDGWIEGTKFVGADFSSVDIKGDFRAANSEFQQNPSTATAVDLEGMKVAGTADLSDSTFDGYVGFGDIHFASLFLNNSKFLGNTNFTRSRTDSVFLDAADFLAGRPKQQELTIEDMSFQNMSPASWEKLKNFADAAKYKPEFYSDLEAQFLRHGYPEEATAVYIAGQRRFRAELWSGFKSAKNPAVKLFLLLRWSVNLLLDITLGFGRHLGRALIVGVVILLLSWFFVFRKEEWMESKKPDDAARLKGTYRGFWYSVDLFLPFIHLGDADAWTPKKEYRFARQYRRVYVVLGTVLVPIGLAAVTGIIK